ncbi:MAG: transcriptional regulator with XRE-family HTH domain [Paraglaciecola sp.]|jgi:transcriptional regulator with XRE-family HTH domain
MLNSKEGFSDRLNCALNEMKFPVRGRTKALNKALNFGISDAAVNNWLCDKTQPNTERMQRIADFTNVNFKWLLLGEGEWVKSNVEHVDFSAFDTNLINAFKSADTTTQQAITEMLKLCA